uniref:A-kinase anchor protein 10, mitochondrial-like isoform X2 n=1 Tax=Myxine glutinosa TaxID=7769 RepID=UPI00358F05CC
MSFIIKRIVKDKQKDGEIPDGSASTARRRATGGVTGIAHKTLPTRNHMLQRTPPPSRDALNAISGEMEGAGGRVRSLSLSRGPTFPEEQHFGDLGHVSVTPAPTSPGAEHQPRLCRTLARVLMDQSARLYFLAHLDSGGKQAREGSRLAHFWLEAENFRQAAWVHFRTRSLDAVKRTSLVGQQSMADLNAEPEGRCSPSCDHRSWKKPNSVVKGDQSCCVPPSDGRMPVDTSDRDVVGMEVHARLRLQSDGGSLLTVSGQTLTDRKLDSTFDAHVEGKLERFGGAVYERLSAPNQVERSSDGVMTNLQREAMGIFSRYISPDIPQAFLIPHSMRNDIVARMCGEDGHVDPNCFLPAQEFVFLELELRYFPVFLQSHNFCMYQIEVFTSDAVSLSDILNDEGALFNFSEYMEKEGGVSVLRFWLTAHDFQSQLVAKAGQYDGQEAQNDAIILYEKYFSLQATCPLGFGDAVRLEVESNICREGGPLPDCFSTPLRQAYTTMEMVYLPGFLSSNMYYKFFYDLVASVRSEERSGPQDRTAHSSTIRHKDNWGPEHSKESSKKGVVKILKNFDEDITIDAKSLEPESLYHRHYAG